MVGYETNAEFRILEYFVWKPYEFDLGDVGDSFKLLDFGQARQRLLDEGFLFGRDEQEFQPNSDCFFGQEEAISGELIAFVGGHPVQVA